MRNVQTTLSHKWFQEVWNNARRDAIDELAVPDVIAHGLYPEGTPQGIETFKSFYDDFKNQIDQISITVDDVLVQDDMEASRCTISARHISSGKALQFSGMCLSRIKDGKLVEAWNHYDFLTMYQQIGMELVQK